MTRVIIDVGNSDLELFLNVIEFHYNYNADCNGQFHIDSESLTSSLEPLGRIIRPSNGAKKAYGARVTITLTLFPKIYE